LFEPISRLVDEVGFDAFNEKIKEFLGYIKGFVDLLNFNEVKTSVKGAIDEAVAAVGELNKVLIDITVNFSLLISQMQSVIDAVNIAQIVEDVKKQIGGFQSLVTNQVNSVFAPVRELLLSSFSTLNNAINAFNPATVIAEALKLMQALTNILTDPAIVNTLDSLRSALDTINQEFGKFSFKPTTDVVVDAIGVVKEALAIAGSIPLPDSLKSEVEKALKVLPPTIRPITDKISIEFTNIVEDGPAKLLLSLKEKPAKLVKLMEDYAPEKLIGDKLTKPYQEFLGKMEQFHPSALLQPVQQALTQLKDKVSKTANPQQFFIPLAEPFNQMLELFNKFNPAELIAPVQAQLTAGIQAITTQLPVDQTDVVFNQLGTVVDKAKQLIAVGGEFKNLLQEIKDRLTGLSDAEAQVAAFINEITSKLDQVSDISGIHDAMAVIGNSINNIKAAPLRNVVAAPLNLLISKLNGLQSKSRLIDLVAAHRGFPRTQLDALPPSTEKTALQTLLNGFDPLSSDFSIPLNSLDLLLTQCQSGSTLIAGAFSDWDSTYHATHSPITKLYQPNITIAELKQMITTAIEKDIAVPLAVIFKVVEHLSSILDTVLTELISLLSELQTKINQLVSIVDSLEEIRQAVNGFIETLNGFNLSFVVDEIESLFQTLKSKLASLNPLDIGQALQDAFDGLLDLLDVNNLLGIEQLDQQYENLLSLLKGLDPKTLAIDPIQKEYDKVVQFLSKIDISEPIDGFVTRLNLLLEELTVELKRVADAYEEMIDTVPSSLSGALSVSVSVSVGGA
ncbi:MAG: hypothetical protein AB1489_40600, partial [Acidobacteriota bacterium]